jgi:hypothetical protein
MRTTLRTFARQTVAGLRQNRLGVLGTVEVRGDNSLRMCDFYQHALHGMARLITAIERRLQPATALALATGQASSSSQANPAPRCWQPKPAAQQPAARRS